MIRCAFDGHAQRANICQGEAKSFFRTSKGTLWPLCVACAQRHRRLVLKVTRNGGIATENAAMSVFDIPIDDPDTLASWERQEPEEIQEVIQAVDDWENA